MEIDIYDNGLTVDDVLDVPHRTACRGIVMKDGLFLIVHNTLYDIYTFPGGGLEPGETKEECVIRELLEETGIEVTVTKETVKINEFFTDSKWSNYYFLCDYVKDTKQISLTIEEQELGLKHVWLSSDVLLDILSNNMTKHEYGPNIHNREFLGLINSL